MIIVMFFFSAHYYTNLCHFIWSTRMTHNTLEPNKIMSHLYLKKNIIQQTIFQIINRLNTEYHKKKRNRRKIKKNSSRKLLAPLWISMCQSVLLKHILLCPCMLRAFGKKIDQLTLIDEGYVLYQVFVIPKKGTYFVLYEN